MIDAKLLGEMNIKSNSDKNEQDLEVSWVNMTKVCCMRHSKN